LTGKEPEQRRSILPGLFLLCRCLAWVLAISGQLLGASISLAAEKGGGKPGGKVEQKGKGGEKPTSPEKKKADKVTFYFVDVDIPTVAKFISEVTGKNFLFDERTKGKITIIAPSKLSVDEAYNLFTSVLELKGLTIVPSGVDAYKIIPAPEAKQRGLEVSTGKWPVNENYIARLIPLTYLSSEEAVRFLQPTVSKDGYISAFGPGNLILVIDSGLNVGKILSIIKSIDQPHVREEPELVILKYANPEAVARVINEGLAKLKARGAPGRPAAAEGMAVADPRLNAVVIWGDQEMRASMKGLIALVDIPAPEAQGRINVYFLENADATELAKVLEGMLKGIQPQRQAAAGAPGAPVTPFEAAGGIIITPDKATNSLVIVTSPADYQNLLPVIKQLDRRRRQVYVEAMIAEVTQDKLFELGTKWRAVVTQDGEPVFVTGFGTMDQAALQGIIAGLTGLTMGGAGAFYTLPQAAVPGGTSDLSIPGLSALFSLSEFKDAINVLSTPQILTADNKEAEIMVGENVPFITGKQTNPQLAASVFSTVERQDVGIKLRITPQIAEGDYIKLDIYQEISAVKQESDIVTLNVGPTTTKRSTKTSVVVKDKQTVVIGGLLQEKSEEAITKVPVLGDIPILGWFFKFKTTSKNKTNLFVFISPHVVRETEVLTQITQEKTDSLARLIGRYIEGELFVRFKDGVPEETALAIIFQKGASLMRVISPIWLYQIKLKPGQSVEDGIKEFSKIPEVRYAEPNYRIEMEKKGK
jgi:general secretion pathway protein D